MSIHGVLGESTSYPKTYKPEALYAIDRGIGRAQINADTERLSQGVDWWHAFEVSWLNPQGVSQVAIARFSIPAHSPNIVESKSLKLYLNSLNFTEFASWQAVEQTISQDLSDCVGAPVTVMLIDVHNQKSSTQLDSFMIEALQGDCIDDALDNCNDKIALLTDPDPSLLSVGAVCESITDYKLYSKLLRSNCPVTNQPDWGSIAIEMSTSVPLNKVNLLKYILSYRQHNGFHEQCVEQIFADLTQYFKPTKLMVRAWYTRRGGIDINPCRVSDMALLPQPSRLIRQ